MSKSTTVGACLIGRLRRTGLKHVFGIPGDYVLGFYDALSKSPIDVVGTTTEANAAFAADAYARVNGLGAVCVTYCVGGLNTINAVAGAYAERSPLIVISGAPGLSERIKSPLLHHRVRDFDTQRRIFEKITEASTALEDPATAPAEIDRVIEVCLRTKRPVYIELPRDLVDAKCPATQPPRAARQRSEPAALREAVEEASAMIRAAKRPVILAGVEIHRFGLQKSLVRFVEKSGLPIAATLLGKSIISELHPQYLGIYEGAMGRDDVRLAVEAADCLVLLGAMLTDIDLGIFTARLDEAHSINAGADRTTIRYHHYEGILLGEFIDRLTRSLPAPRSRRFRMHRRAAPPPYRSRPSQKITVRRFFARMNDFLTADMIVISDIGDSLFGAADLTIHRRTEFISPAYYTSMGFAVPAALGAQTARRRLRPIVFVGDGAFQMTGQEISNIARHKLNPIIFVLNNQGYTTERFIREGPYNDIQEWAYHLYPGLVRAGWGAEVFTEGDLEDVLAEAKQSSKSFSLINVHLDKLDTSEALVRLGERLGARTGR